MESFARRFKPCGRLRESIAKDHDNCWMVGEMTCPKNKNPCERSQGLMKEEQRLCVAGCGDLAGAAGNHQNRHPQGDHSAERHNATNVDLGQFVSGLYRKALVHG